MSMNFLKIKIMSPEKLQIGIQEQILEIVDENVYLNKHIKQRKDNQTAEIASLAALAKLQDFQSC